LGAQERDAILVTPAAESNRPPSGLHVRPSGNGASNEVSGEIHGN